MSPRRARALAIGAVGTLVAVGCTETETQTRTETVFAPYDGDPAYPNERPSYALPDGPVGLTSDNGSDTLTVLDLDAAEVLGMPPVGRDPVDLDGPHHVAADRKRGIVYTALAYPAPPVAPGPHAAHGSSQRDGFVQRLALDDFRVLGEVRVDPNPGDIVLSDDGGRIVVTHFDLLRAIQGTTVEEKRATMAVIEPEAILHDGSPSPKRVTICGAPHGVALSRPSGDRAYVACYGEDVVAIADLTADEPTVERVPVGPGGGDIGAPSYGPYSTVLSPDGERLVLGNTESNDLRFLRTSDRTMEELVVSTLGAPYFPAWWSDGSKLVVPTQTPDGLLVVDAATGAEIASRFFQDGECDKPHEVVLGPGDARLYVVCEGDHKAPGAVLDVDPETLETRASFAVGVYPDRLIVLPAP